MAEKFTRIVGAGAPLPIDNIDTNVIAPGMRQSQSGQKRAFDTFGAGRQPMNLFARWRFDEHDAERPDFILNRPGFRDAKILLAGANFGCGSSRETAVLYLLDFGIHVVIAQSFGEIFYNNCFKHGVLPLAFDAPTMRRLLDEAAPGGPQAIFTIDLECNRVVSPSGTETPFQLPEFRRQGLLQGVDEIGLTLTRLSEIDAFHERVKRERPWAFPAPISR
jgi:3-isopropylmalate/(R)-2-methylmalate dehydratase small subunit